MAGAQSRIELIVEAARALNPLQKVKNQTKRLEDAVKNAQNGIKKFNRQLRDTKSASGKAAQGIGALTKAVGKAVIAYASFTAAQSAVSKSIQRIESERRIQFLAKGYGEVTGLSQAAADAARKFGVSQTEANRALAGVFARLRPVGVSLEDIVSTYNGFNTAARISGASAVEAENAFTQLAQALGSGALRGDEFNSISEQVPGILTAISKETGVAQGKLRAYAAEGKITADIVIRALKSIEKDGAEQLAEALNGPAQKIRDFQNATEEVQIALTDAVIPDLANSFRDLAGIIRDLEPAIRFIGGRIAAVLGGAKDMIGLLKSGTAGTEAAIRAGRVPLEGGDFMGRGQGSRTLFQGVQTPFGVGIEGIKKEARALAITRAAPGTDVFGPTFKTPDKILNEVMKKYLDVMSSARTMGSQFDMGLGGLRTESGGALLSPDKDKKTKETPLQRQQRLLKDIVREEQNRRLLATQTTEKQRLGAQFAIEYADIQRNLNLLGEDQVKLATDELTKTYLAQLATIDKAAEEKKAADAKMKALKAEQVEAQRLQQVYQQIGSTISNGVVGMLQAAFDSTKSLADAALNMLQNLANQLLQIAVNSALFGLFPGSSMFAALPRFANGGSISGGQPAIVGEKGPELFMPGRSGSIVPNNALGGATINVNVDASGSRVEGDTTEQRRLGEAIGVAIRQELIKQKRPGGLLA